MSVLLIVAAVLVSLLAVAHSYLGERHILLPLFRRSEPPIAFRGRSFTRHTLRLAWHLTTVAWLGLAGQLVVLARPSGDGMRNLAQVIAGTFAVSGIVALFGSRGRHPSWVVFFIVAVLMWLAYR